MFIISKKVISSILAGGVIMFSGMNIMVPTAFAQEEPVQIVNDGTFKMAQLGADQLTTEYHLAKYDVISIMMTGFTDGTLLESSTSATNLYNSLNEITIGPDGYAQVPYAGNVKLAGLTIDEARLVLIDAMSEYIKVPQLSVSVKTYGERKIYVMGEVEKSGIQKMTTDSLNVFAALSSAGGVTNRGRIKHVQVLRTIGDTMYYKEVNMDNYVKKHDMSQNLELQDGDIVYVPSSNKIVFSEDILPYVSAFAMYKSITN